MSLIVEHEYNKMVEQTKKALKEDQELRQEILRLKYKIERLMQDKNLLQRKWISTAREQARWHAKFCQVKHENNMLRRNNGLGKAVLGKREREPGPQGETESA
jgi:hypothetical protein